MNLEKVTNFEVMLEKANVNPYFSRKFYTKKIMIMIMIRRRRVIPMITTTTTAAATCTVASNKRILT
jgi:hypothetical protein